MNFAPPLQDSQKNTDGNETSFASGIVYDQFFSPSLFFQKKVEGVFMMKVFCFIFCTDFLIQVTTKIEVM